MTDFDEFWTAYPKHAQRSKKAVSRAIFEAITGPGRHTKVDGLDLSHQETPGVLIAAAKAYRMVLIQSSEGDENPYKYAQGSQVWLNQGRFEDFDDDEREELAAKWDDLQERISRNKLRVV